MTFIISYVLVSIAAGLNALMDTIGDHVHFNASIFSNWKKEFWSKEISWQYAKKVFGWKYDGWHVAKSIMIICLVVAIVVFKPYYQWWVHFISIGLIWNGSFNLFYKIFNKK